MAPYVYAAGVLLVVLIAVALLLVTAYRDGRREALEEAAILARELARGYEGAPISNAFTEEAERFERRERRARASAAREVAIALEDRASGTRWAA
jgi:cbb3-type cytochrome oxidase subunit 3